MKFLLFITCITALFSCQKQTDALIPEATSNAGLATGTEHSYNYSVSLDGIEVSNPCVTESMIMSGDIKVHIVDNYVNGELHLLITTRYDHVTATGIVTGTLYKA